MLCIGKAALFFIFFFFSFRVAEIGYCFSNRLSMMPTSNSQQVPADLPALPKGATTPFALLTALLSHKLRYRAHERDMVVLTHEVIAAPANQNQNQTPNQDQSQSENESEEVYTSTLVTYGNATDSAMSRTVGLPIAFAALRVLDGGVRVRGVRAPVDKEVYHGVLQDLEAVGLGMQENVVFGKGMGEQLVRSLER